MSDPLIAALSGRTSTALAEDVSLATPLTAPRISGRGAVSAALGAYRDVLGGPEATVRLKGDERDAAVYSGCVDGRSTEIVAVATHDAAGLVSTIDLYGRPWPFVALLREAMAKVEPDLADPDLGTGAYVPEGSTPVWVDHGPGRQSSPKKISLTSRSA